MTFDWLKKPVVQRVGRIAGYVVFGMVVFTIATIVTFPTPKLKSYLENRLSTGGRIVRISDMSLRGLASARLFGVALELPPAQHTLPDGQIETQKRRLALDQVDVSVGLFRLLFGGLSVELTIHDGDGVLGPLRLVRSGGRITASLDTVRDFPIPDELPLFGVRFDGRLQEARIRLDYDEKAGLAESTGDVELKGSGIRAIQPTLRSRAQGNVSLSDASLGALVLEVHLGKRSNMGAFKADRRSPLGDETLVHLARAELDGNDIKALVEGQSTIRLAPGKPLGESQLNLEAAFSFADAFIDRKVKSGAEVRTPNAFLRTLLSMDPRWRNAQSGNYWGVVCTGMLSRPVCNPKKPAIRGGDFKAPPKAEPEVEEPAAPAPTPSAPAPRPTPAAPTPRTTAAPAPSTAPLPVIPPSAVPGPAPMLPAPQLTPPPRRDLPPPVETPQIEAPPQVQAAPIDQVNAPMEVRTAPLRPTVIGRARLRGMAAEEEAGDSPAEGEAPSVPGEEE